MSVSLSTSAVLPPCAVLPVTSPDGARVELLLQRPAGDARSLVFWLPALGVAAKHYLPLAQSLAGAGIAVAIHEWRGIGSSDKRASRQVDWGYRELLEDDVPAAVAAVRAAMPHTRLLLGGHSLGGQIASLYVGLHPRDIDGLLLVASGAPYWRQFPQGRALWLAYAVAPWLARAVGHLPGRKIGFGGNEARQLIDDWARTGRTGRYAAVGVHADIEAALGRLSLPILAMRMRDDWFVPRDSLSWLLGKMPRSASTSFEIAAAELGDAKADHFGWMKSPEAVVSRVVRWLDAHNASPGT